MEARQVAIGEEEAWGMLARAGKLLVGRGAKVEAFTPSENIRSEILGRVLGRSGTLRAPTLKIGPVFLIGFNAEMYRSFFTGGAFEEKP